MKGTLCSAALALGFVTSLGVFVEAEAPAQRGGEPGWSYGVVRVGNEREAIKSKPMTERPYRPLHFYGNTVRRLHYRGTALPAPRDLVGASAATLLRQ